MKKIIKRIVFILMIVALAVGIPSVIINMYVVSYSDNYIISDINLPSSSYAIVLGARAYLNDTPSPVLANRLDKAIHLLEIGRVDSLILTGAENDAEGREATTMRKYARANGVDDMYIVTDGDGLNTKTSMEFVASLVAQDPRPVIICTQKFHLNRAVYIARKLGIEAYGAVADDADGMGLFYLSIREMAARVKDFFLIAIGR